MEINLKLGSYAEDKIFLPTEAVEVSSFSSEGQLKKYRLNLQNAGYNFGKHGKSIRYDLESLKVLEAMLQIKTQKGLTIEEVANTWSDWEPEIILNNVRARDTTKKSRTVSQNRPESVSYQQSTSLPEGVTVALPTELQLYLQQQQQNNSKLIQTLQETVRSLNSRLESAQTQASRIEDNRKSEISRYVVQIEQFEKERQKLNDRINELENENKQLAGKAAKSAKSAESSKQMYLDVYEHTLSKEQIKQVIKLGLNNVKSSFGRVRMEDVEKALDTVFHASFGERWNETDAKQLSVVELTTGEAQKEQDNS